MELRHPVLKLYPLEIHGSTLRPHPVDLQTDIPEPVAVEPAALNSTVRTRPKRKAVLRARERIALWARDLMINVLVLSYYSVFLVLISQITLIKEGCVMNY